MGYFLGQTHFPLTFLHTEGALAAGFEHDLHELHDRPPKRREKSPASAELGARNARRAARARIRMGHLDEGEDDRQERG